MRGKEWPLVIFTLLVQMAIGLLLVVTVFCFLTTKIIAPNRINELSSIFFLIIDLLLIIGVLIATFHLGQPINARLAMANYKKSWLSREMLLGLAFGFVMLILSMMSWTEIKSSFAPTFLLIIGGVVGITLLYAISRIYMLRTVPVWNHISTPLTFFTTAFLLGTLAFSAVWIWHLPTIVTRDLQPSLVESSFQWIKTSSAVLVGLQLLWAYGSYRKYASRIDSWDGANTREWIKYRIALFFRIALGEIGIAFLFNFMDQELGGFEFTDPRVILLICAFLLILTSEILGRFMFYISNKRFGI
jgi:anaerobic dimethyl sulfoxide reductase subunit C (anchor subunit)